MDLTRFQQQLTGVSSETRSLPPVDKWDPPFCGNINLEILLDGSWIYEGSPIGRASLVRLFSTVLKREGDNYFLVTPAEKVGIRVEDTPFIIVEWENKEDTLVFTTQSGDTIPLKNLSQLQLRVPPSALSDENATAIPYLCVRRNLWARLHQNVYYQLLAHATETTKTQNNVSTTQFSVISADKQFVIGEVTL